MPRRLLRIAPAGFCLLSLMACLGIGWLWWRSYRGAWDGHSFRRGDARYTVRSAGGRVALYGPPHGQPADTAGRPTAAGVLAAITNDDIRWWVNADDPDLRTGLDALARGRGPAAGLNPEWDDQRKQFAFDFAPAEATPHLLRALEEPGRFAAAHYGLSRLNDPYWSYLKADRLPDGSVRCLLGGLRVDLRPYDHREDSSGTHFFDGAATIDAAQLPAIRAQWHRRLDVPVWSVPWWPFVTAAALPPMLWLVAWGRRRWVLRRRTRLGLCRRCGYDLRGSPPRGRCSECGGAMPPRP